MRELRDEPEVQVLAGLFAAGATLALLTAALPHPASASALGLLLTVGAAYLSATLLFWRASTTPAWTLPVVLGWGTTLIAGVAYFSAGTPSPVVFFFLWSSLYASYFFTTTGTAIQVIYIGLAYGALLARAPAGERRRGLVDRRHGHPARRRDPDPLDARARRAADRAPV